MYNREGQQLRTSKRVFLFFLGGGGEDRKTSKGERGGDGEAEVQRGEGSQDKRPGESNWIQLLLL